MANNFKKSDLDKLEKVILKQGETNKINSVVFPHTIRVGLSDNSHYNATISGSIHLTHEGKSYLVAGNNITITSGSNGQITITAAVDGDITAVTAGTGLSGGGTTGAVTLSTNDSEIVHDNLSGFVSNEHINHSSVSVTAGNGLTGGGDITTSRTIAVGAGTGITVNTNDVAFDPDGGTLTTLNADIDQILINDGGVFKRIAPGNINISGFNNDSGYTTNTGTVTNVTVNAGLDVVNGTAVPNISLDLSELTTSTDDGHGDYFIVVDTANQQRKLTKGNINLSGFNNDSNFSTLTLANGVNNRIVTATGADAMNAEANLTFDGSDLYVNGNVKTVGIEYTDGDSALTISDGGYLTVEEGILNSSAVKVNSTYVTSANQWIKIAAADSSEGNDTAITTFLIHLSGLEYNTTYDNDASFIVNAKFTYYTASPYYRTTGTYLTVETLHGENLNSFDPTTDIAMTFDNSGNWELWIKSKIGYKDCYASILGGTREASFISDPGAVIQTGQTFSASLTSLGTEVYGQWKTHNIINVKGSSTDPLVVVENEAADDSEFYRALSSGESDPDAGCILLRWYDNASDSIYVIFGNGVGGSTVSTSFTAGHDTVISGSLNVQPGMIVESTGEVWYKPVDKTYETALPKCQIAASNGSKKVFGVISGYPIRINSNGEQLINHEEAVYAQNGFIMAPSFSKYGVNAGIDPGWWNISTMSIGEGVIWVTNINGEIENGDLIESSEIPGFGRRQDDDIIRSKTVAKCTEDINWDMITDVFVHNGQEYKRYLASCTFHCG